MNYRVLYNPLAGNGHGEENAKQLSNFYKESELIYYDMTKIESYPKFFDEIGSGDVIIICGGDGTLHRFINDTEGLDIRHDILYYATGSGNDFQRDVASGKGNRPFKINKYLKSLPVVTVNGKSKRFLNNVGFGIDGYCCEMGDKLRETTDKPIHYPLIAIKGMLGGFEPVNATVTVEGKKYTYDKVWLAPTMNGRYYGGGMMPTPEQDRLNKDRHVSVMVFHGAGKLKALVNFPSLFKGEHVKRTDIVSIITGREVTVEFDRPCALQIDGETVPGVTGYHVTTAKIA